MRKMPLSEASQLVLKIVASGCVLLTASAPLASPVPPLIAEPFDQAPCGKGVPEGWWSEGGAQAEIEQGRLRVRANPADNTYAADPSAGVCTVWCPQPVAGDLRIAFDACVIASVPEVRNINLFFLYSDPSGRPLNDTRRSRQDGAYAHYHALNGYILTFLADYPAEREYHPDGTAKARLRLRHCPGFRLMQETHDHHCATGIVYHVEVVRKQGRITCAVDGKVYLDAADTTPHAAGLIGLRTFRTDLWFDNLKVTPVAEGERSP